MSQFISPDPSPSDVIYDDMTRAWRNGDYPLCWSLADALLTYLANDGQPLTDSPLAGHRDVYYARRVYVRYAPVPGVPDAAESDCDWCRLRQDITDDALYEDAIDSDRSE